MDVVVRTTLSKWVELKLEWLRIIQSRLPWVFWVLFGLCPGQTYLRAGEIGTGLSLIGFLPLFIFVLSTLSVLRRPPHRGAQFTFSQDGIRVQGVDWETMLQWEGVKKVEQKAGCFLIHTVSGLLFVLPLADIPVQARPEIERLLRRASGG